ncbi:MAG: hypothetical protein RMJ98_23220, partial [Myxococcales bacterium]|nr:hypothetical protein [Myxococcales bacterium]
FLARPAGMSRDTQEPAQSFRNLGPWYAAQATKRESAEQALLQARQARRLQVMLCSELGAPVITLGDGSPISCGETQAADDLRFAEARALITQGNLAAAFSIAATQRELKTRPRRLADLDAAIEAAAPSKKVNGKPLKVMPVASRVALPIAFDDKGMLQVISEEGVVQVDPATGAENPSQTPRWNPLAELVGDMKVLGGGDDCKGGFQWVQLQGSGEVQKLATTIPGNFGVTCISGTRLLPLLDRNSDGLTVALQGEPIFIPKEGDRAQGTAWPATPGGLGTARSPDGRWTALNSVDHLLLRGPDRNEVWKPTTRFYLTACTVANEAKAAACLLERGAVIFTP